MPRKPKLEKQSVTVVIGGTPYTVILHPPGGSRKSWYAYRNGLVSSKSTGQRNLNDAVAVVEAMVSDWLAGRDCKRPLLGDAVMSDEEFEELQRQHFAKKKDAAAQARAAKTLKDCLEAIRAFRDIIRAEPVNFTQPIALVRPDICAAFQREALKRPKN